MNSQNGSLASSGWIEQEEEEETLFFLLQKKNTKKESGAERERESKIIMTPSREEEVLAPRQPKLPLYRSSIDWRGLFPQQLSSAQLSSAQFSSALPVWFGFVMIGRHNAATPQTDRQITGKNAPQTVILND